MKKYEKIRSIATSQIGDKFAVAEFEQRIQVWNSNGLIRVLNTDLDFGGKRISISNDGKSLVVGSYEKNTITNYSVDTGEVLWKRKDLKKCGVIHHIEHEPRLIFVTLQDQESQLLSESGDTFKRISHVTEYWQSANGEHNLLEKANDLSLVDKEWLYLKSLSKTAFAILDCCFTGSEFIASYSGGPIEARDLNSLELKWVTKMNGHFLKLGYNDSIDKFLAIGWNYIDGGPKILYHLNRNTGTLEDQFNLGDIVEASFFENYNFLITSTGKLISTSDGKTEGEFDFEGK